MLVGRKETIENSHIQSRRKKEKQKSKINVAKKKKKKKAKQTGPSYLKMLSEKGEKQQI